VSAPWVTFLFEAANFLLLAGVLGWLFFRPVRDALERRRSELEAEQRAAAEARSEAEHVLHDVRKRQLEAENEAEAIRERIRTEAEAERDRFVEAARTQMQRERDKLQDEFSALRRGHARSMGRDAASAAREIVIRLLEQMGGPELEPTLQRAACRSLEQLRSTGNLAPMVIESATALDDATLAAFIEAAGVAEGEASHHVNADLLTGFRIVTAKGLVDASAAGLAAQAERVLADQIERDGMNDD